jgi:hypothetical protein
MLDYNEIYDLSRVCLNRYIAEGKDGMLNMITEHFTNFIFNCLKIPVTEEIPLDNIKKEILKGNENSKLLKMFCGADI